MDDLTRTGTGPVEGTQTRSTDCSPPHGLAVEIPGYEVFGEVGRGAMGVVYKARHASLNRTVALKVIADPTASITRLIRFRQEAEAVAKLQHPNIIQIFEVGCEKGVSFLALEFVDGGTLKAATAGVPQPPRDAARTLETLARAVQHAHDRRILHRDLKPHNILLTSVGVLKVADFGLARSFDVGSGITGTSDFVGTPAYMAPEQVQQKTDLVGPATDGYALGVILYELLTGRVPFDASNVPELFREIVDTNPIPPRRLRPDCPRDLETICMKCLRKEPEKRYATATELADDLHRFLADEPIRARPVGSFERVSRWTKRNPTVALLLLAVGLLLGGGAVAGGVLAGQFKQQRDDALEARNDANDAKNEALDAKREGDRKLWEALVAQADANRMSRRSGQQFATLDRLREAVAMAKKLELPPSDYLRMRNAAIAALAQPDLHPGPPYIDWPEDAHSIDVPEAFDVYARSSKSGSCTVRRVKDDVEIYRLSGLSPTFSRDGKYLALHQPDGSARVWRLGGPDAVLVVDSHASNYVQFDPSGSRVAFVSFFRSVDVFDLATGQNVLALTEAMAPREPSIAFHPTEPLMAICSYFSTDVRVLNLRDRTTVSFFPSRTGGSASLTWNPAGTVLAVANYENGITFHEHGTWKLLRTSPGTAGGGALLSFNSAGDRILSRIGWTGGTPLLIDPQIGRILFNRPGGGVVGRFSPDGKYLAGVVEDGKFSRLRVADGRAYRKFVHAKPVAALNHSYFATTPDSRVLVVATNVGGKNGFGVWDLDRGQEIAFLPGGSANSLEHLTIDLNGNLLMNGLSGVYRWPIRASGSKATHLTVGPPERLPGLPGSLEPISLNADGSTVAIACRAVSTRQVNAGAWVHHADRPYQPVGIARGEDVWSASLSPDGQQIVTWIPRIGHSVWDAKTGGLIRKLGPYSGYGYGFTDDGRWFDSGNQRWNTTDWSATKRIAGIPSPDGQTVLDVTATGILILKRADTGAELARLEPPELDSYLGLQFTPDGTKFLASGPSGVHVWDLRRLRAELAELGLDWDLSAFAPAPPSAGPLTAEIVGREQFYDRKKAAIAERNRLVIALWANPLDGAAYYQLAFRELQADHDEAAFELASTAVRLLPDYPNAVSVRAEAATYLARWPVVIADASWLLARNANDGRARQLRAKAYAATGNHSDAAADLTLLIAQYPKSTALLLARATASEALGQFSQADADVRAADPLVSDADLESINNLAWQLATGRTEVRNPSRALELTNKLAVAAPKSANYLNTIGVVQYRNGRFSEAVQSLTQSLIASRGSSSAHDLYFLAMAHAKLGDLAKARSSYLEAFRWTRRQLKLSAHDADELRRFRAEAEQVLREAEAK